MVYRDVFYQCNRFSKKYFNTKEVQKIIKIVNQQVLSPAGVSFDPQSIPNAFIGNINNFFHNIEKDRSDILDNQSADSPFFINFTQTYYMLNRKDKLFYHNNHKMPIIDANSFTINFVDEHGYYNIENFQRELFETYVPDDRLHFVEMMIMHIVFFSHKIVNDNNLFNTIDQVCSRLKDSMEKFIMNNIVHKQNQMSYSNDQMSYFNEKIQNTEDTPFKKQPCLHLNMHFFKIIISAYFNTNIKIDQKEYVTKQIVRLKKKYKDYAIPLKISILFLVLFIIFVFVTYCLFKYKKKKEEKAKEKKKKISMYKKVLIIACITLYLIFSIIFGLFGIISIIMYNSVQRKFNSLVIN